MHTNSAKFQQKSFSFAFFLLSAIFFRLSAEIEQFCQNFILANSHCRVLPSVQERITKKRENNAYDFMYSANFNKILLLWSYFAVSNFFGGFHHAFFRRSADKQTFGQTTVGQTYQKISAESQQTFKSFCRISTLSIEEELFLDILNSKVFFGH